MRRIISFLAVAALMVAMLIGSAMPAFAAPSFTPGECNAGGGNGAEKILDDDGDVTGECDPGNSGTTDAADNDELEDDEDDDGDDDEECDPEVDDCDPAGND
jgi:hypothetical protein